MLLRRGVVALGGGATEKKELPLGFTFEWFQRLLHNGGGDEWLVKLFVVPSVKLPELNSC